jgi:hypothetical protein
MRSARHRTVIGRVRSPWTVWFLVGLLAALWLQWTQASTSHGDWTGLISTGVESPMRPAIEHELGAVSLAPRDGHDGQSSFLIAVDPFNRDATGALLDDAAYRYRRILYPLLAGGAGLLPARAALIGLILLAAIGMGLATAAMVGIAERLDVSRWVVLGILANPGIWMSVRLLTSDALALGLALTGLLLWWDRRTVWATAAFALAALAKDQYLLVALSAAGWTWFRGTRRQTVGVAVGAIAPLALWVVWLTRTMGNAATVKGNFALFGFLDAYRVWPTTPTSDQLLIGFVLIGVVAGIVVPLGGSPLLRWLTWPWVALALITSGWVWNLGNNAARVFAPLWIFVALGLGVLARRHASQTSSKAVKRGTS